MGAIRLAYELQERGCSAAAAAWISIKYIGRRPAPRASVMARACGMKKKALVQLEEHELKLIDYNIRPF